MKQYRHPPTRWHRLVHAARSLAPCLTLGSRACSVPTAKSRRLPSLPGGSTHVIGVCGDAAHHAVSTLYTSRDGKVRQSLSSPPRRQAYPKKASRTGTHPVLFGGCSHHSLSRRQFRTHGKKRSAPRRGERAIHEYRAWQHQPVLLVSRAIFGQRMLERERRLWKVVHFLDNCSALAASTCHATVFEQGMCIWQHAGWLRGKRGREAASSNGPVQPGIWK